MKTLQAVQVLALYMQGQFTSGVPYGSMGTPNMQSIVELADKPDIDATAFIATSPELSRLARAHGLL